MSNTTFTKDLTENMQNLSFDGSNLNLINIDYDAFLDSINNITGCVPIKLNKNNTVLCASLSIPQSDNFTAKLNSNFKNSNLSDTSMLGKLNISMDGGFIHIEGCEGVCVGLCTLQVAVAGTLAMLGYQCTNDFHLVSKVNQTPLNQSEKDEMITTEDGSIISVYDSVNGKYMIPKSTFCALVKYIRRLGWLSNAGSDTRTGYYGLTKYNVLSVERNYNYYDDSGKYVPHKGVNRGTSGTVAFHYILNSDEHAEMRTESYAYTSNSDVYMDFWCDINKTFHITLYSLSPITTVYNGHTYTSDEADMIQNDKIFTDDFWTHFTKSDVSIYTLDGWTGKESPNEINYIDAYNQLKGSINNAMSSVVNSVSNGINTMSEIDNNSRFIVFKMEDGIRYGNWMRTGKVTMDFSVYTFTSPVYAYMVRYVNTSGNDKALEPGELNTIRIYFCSLSSFSFREVWCYKNDEPQSDSIRTASSVTVEGHTFYEMTTYALGMGDYLLCDATLAFPVIEYDCGGKSRPQNPIDPISDYVKWQLLNITPTPTDIGEGTSGSIEGLNQVGTQITITDEDTSTTIWNKATSNLPNSRFGTNVLSVLTPETNVIIHEDGIAISLPTSYDKYSLVTSNSTSNNTATNYTGSNINSQTVANIVGSTITEVGLDGDSINSITDTSYDVEKQRKTVEATQTGIGNTPESTASSGESNAMYSVYRLTQAELDSFGSWLWTSDFFTRVVKAWDNPMENIISLNKVYCDLPTGTASTIAIGNIDSQVTCKKLNDRYASVDFGSVNINEYFGNMLDYSPYTDIQIYLPFIGIVRLDNADVMRGTVKLKYKVDLFTGDLLAIISVYRDMVEQTAYQFNGNCSVSYPYSASTSLGGNLKRMAGIATLIGATVATSGATALAMGVAGATSLATASTNTQHSGNLDGSVGVLGSRTPYIIITRPQVVSTDSNKKFVGTANNIVDKISNHTGFIKVTEPQIQITGTKEEIDTITSMLQNGILI